MRNNNPLCIQYWEKVFESCIQQGIKTNDFAKWYTNHPHLLKDPL